MTTVLLLLIGFTVGAATVRIGDRISDRAAERRAFLRHPLHPARCACGRWGQPGDGSVTIRDEDGYHTRLRCYRLPEHIERED